MKIVWIDIASSFLSNQYLCLNMNIFVRIGNKFLVSLKSLLTKENLYAILKRKSAASQYVADRGYTIYES